MAKQTIKVPDIGGAENVDVIELCVAVGDSIAEDDSLIVLESDKASMDVPSPVAGKLVSFTVNEGDKVSEGDVIAEIEVEAAGVEATPAEPQSSAVTETPVSVGASEIPVSVPDIGGAEGVDVIEVCVAVGDSVSEGDSLIVLESDKASMEIPSPSNGVVQSIALVEGAKVSEGDAVLVLTGDAPATAAVETAEAPSAPVAETAAVSTEEDILVPDIGGAEGVDVIEVCVSAGDEVAEGDSIIVLESDKASMDIPAPKAGKIVSLALNEGDKVSQGDKIGVLTVAGSASQPVTTESEPTKATAPQAKTEKADTRPQSTNELNPQEIVSSGSAVYAGPAVRKLSREMAVDLSNVRGSGPKGRISKDDVKAYVKSVMLAQKSTPAATGGSGIPAIPDQDFSKFGEIEIVKMSKIHQVTAMNMSRNWLNVPHVTQFDDADITDLEDFRKGMKADAEKAGVKLTPVPFLLKAIAAALKYEPSFNVSLHSDGKQLIKKKYIHIGMAVATPSGLMVPVIRDVDKKGLYELAEESVVLAKKARDGKLLPKDMQGGCFTISSLGAIGGTGFTPIVNAPEVAILGVSKAAIKPVWNGSEFVPRNMLPLALSYDHRAINGADAGNFFTYLSSVLGDVRKLLI